jgi:hypothetical protein
VKDKSKQISLYLFDVTPEFLMLHAHMFRQIHHLHIRFLERNFNELNFNMFNDIHHVELNRLRGITTINSGFENVRILTLSRAVNLTHVDLRHVKLDKLSVNDCPRISVLKGVNSVRCINIDVMQPNLEGFQVIPNVPYESISLFSDDLSLDMLHHCDLSHLQCLSLFDLCNLGGDDLSIFMNIQHLSLGASKNIGRSNFPSLPIFNGTSLELVRFNLERWSSADCIPNVKRIKIVECANVDPHLSFLRNVRVVSVNRNDEINHFFSLAYCTELELTYMKYLTAIAGQPRLRVLKIANCPNLSDYATDGQFLNQVQIRMCRSFSPLNTFRNTRELILQANRSFDPSGLDQSDLPSTDRIVRITINSAVVSSCPATINCSGIANIHLLKLTAYGELGEVSHLHDIHTIQIDNSFGEIKEVSYLRNIQELQLTHMKDLRSLHHLENIEKIMLFSFQQPDFRFDGLKGCRIVYSRGNKKLEQQAELYSRGERDASLFESNYLEMFSSIEEFYVVAYEGAEGTDWQKLQGGYSTRLW